MKKFFILFILSLSYSIYSYGQSKIEVVDTLDVPGGNISRGITFDGRSIWSLYMFHGLKELDPNSKNILSSPSIRCNYIYQHPYGLTYENGYFYSVKFGTLVKFPDSSFSCEYGSDKKYYDGWDNSKLLITAKNGNFWRAKHTSGTNKIKFEELDINATLLQSFNSNLNYYGSDNTSNLVFTDPYAWYVNRDTNGVSTLYKLNGTDFSVLDSEIIATNNEFLKSLAFDGKYLWIQDFNSPPEGRNSIHIVDIGNFVGINENSRLSTVKVIPNPSVNGMFYIHSDGVYISDKTLAKVFNNTGQLVVEENNFFMNGKGALDLRSFDSGVYYLQLFEKEILYKTEKLVKQ